MVIHRFLHHMTVNFPDLGVPMQSPRPLSNQTQDLQSLNIFTFLARTMYDIWHSNDAPAFHPLAPYYARLNAIHTKGLLIDISLISSAQEDLLIEPMAWKAIFFLTIHICSRKLTAMNEEFL